MVPLIKCVLIQYVDNEELTFEISNVLCDTGAEASIISSDDGVVDIESKWTFNPD